MLPARGVAAAVNFSFPGSSNKEGSCPLVARCPRRSPASARGEKGGNGKRNSTGAVVRGRRPQEVYKMVLQPSLLSAVPGGVLDMTADLAPLFVGLVVGLGMCVLGLAFAIG